MIQPDAELPEWQCHKVVRAAKITSVKPMGASGLFTLELEGGLEVHVTYVYYQKHQPTAGNYYVRYEDGYESLSPPKAFEDGYKRVIK